MKFSKSIIIATIFLSLLLILNLILFMKNSTYNKEEKLPTKIENNESNINHKEYQKVGILDKNNTYENHHLNKVIKKDVNNTTVTVEETKKIEYDNAKDIVAINYSGKYSYGYENHESEKQRGFVEIKQKNDDISFRFEIDSGAPDFNIGEFYGKIKLKNNEAIFIGKGLYKKCTINFKFNYDSIEVIQNGTSGDCGFGMGIVTSGKYRRE